jgi:hypothetical protein
LAIHLLSAEETERAEPVLDEVLKLARSVDDWASMAQSLTGIGLVAQRRGAWEESARGWADASRHAREADDAAGKAYALVHLGITSIYKGTRRLPNAS